MTLYHPEITSGRFIYFWDKSVHDAMAQHRNHVTYGALAAASRAGARSTAAASVVRTYRLWLMNSRERGTKFVGECGWSTPAMTPPRHC